MAKKVGEQLSWPDVNGREHTGEVIEVLHVYTVRTPDGMVYKVSKKEN